MEIDTLLKKTTDIDLSLDPGSFFWCKQLIRKSPAIDTTIGADDASGVDLMRHRVLSLTMEDDE
jgi:hypothetical protein